MTTSLDNFKQSETVVIADSATNLFTHPTLLSNSLVENSKSQKFWGSDSRYIGPLKASNINSTSVLRILTVISVVSVDKPPWLRPTSIYIWVLITSGKGHLSQGMLNDCQVTTMASLGIKACQVDHGQPFFGLKNNGPLQLP
ncbi:hypothetical protein K435DRAFT_805285 [Dendrothele bispora CBS 962.96]|uniref:Uncharacterized protein n=1 Tax=Dendrothele bispora (strain CBS 962.96) TaxID=1314807 RepID=A0A4S8LBH0_DENBC|nr:hypothetical protein K435DRAFT_805285 [Dendrothele bispora CBS 962.96]